MKPLSASVQFRTCLCFTRDSPFKRSISIYQFGWHMYGISHHVIPYHIFKMFYFNHSVQLLFKIKRHLFFHQKQCNHLQMETQWFEVNSIGSFLGAQMSPDELQWKRSRCLASARCGRLWQGTLLWMSGASHRMLGNFRAVRPPCFETIAIISHISVLMIMN